MKGFIFKVIFYVNQFFWKMMGFLTEGIWFGGICSEGIQFGGICSEGIQIEGQHSFSPQIIDFTFSRPPNSKDL